MKKYFYGIAFLLWLLAACNKNTAVDGSAGDLLTSRPWIPSLTDDNKATNPKGNVIYFAFLSCQNDDTYTFSNNQLTLNTGLNHCDVKEAQSTDYNYTIDKVSNTININYIPFTLAEVSATQLKYYMAIPGVSGIQYVVYIYHH